MPHPPALDQLILGAAQWDPDTEQQVVGVGFNLMVMLMVSLVGYLGVSAWITIGRSGTANPWAALGLPGPVENLWRLLLCGVAMAVVAGVLLHWSRPEESSAMQWVTVLPQSLLATAAIACLAPLFEEIFFRGFLFSSLAHNSSRITAAWISGGFFLLVHVPQHIGYLTPIVPILLVTIVTTWLRYRTDSVTPGFAVHLGYNSTLVIVSLLNPWLN